MKNEQVVRGTEHLAAIADEVINQFHEGQVSGVQAKLMLIAELQRTVDHIQRGAFENVLWLRVSVPDTVEAVGNVVYLLATFAQQRHVKARLISIRKLGCPQPQSPRQIIENVQPDAQAVLYVTLACKEPHIRVILQALDEVGATVRDWHYGCTA